MNRLNSAEKIGNQLREQFIENELWMDYSMMLIKAILIILLSRLVIKIGKAIAGKYFLVSVKSPLRVSERRKETLLKLLENMITYIVNFVAIIMILELFGFEVKALLAGAGIIGLAIGFGAQSLVKDIISGFFIIFEDQFCVGDRIKVKDFEGEVLEIGIRTTKIKSSTGQLHVIPNGNIMEVTNFSVLNSVAVIDLTVPYMDRIDELERVIEEKLASLADHYGELTSKPELLGIQELSQSEIVLRITAETLPGRDSYMGRILRKELKDCLDAYGWNVQAESES